MPDQSNINITELKRWAAENRESLKAAGVAVIEATYAGSGDEGRFEGIEALGESGLPSGYVVPSEIETLFEDLVDVLAPDGYANNDGGGGEIRLVVETGMVTHESYHYSVERYPDEYQEF